MDRISAALVLVVLSATSTAAARIPVTTCGMAVSGIGELTGDLDCSAHPGHAIILDGRLDLNGFTLQGNAAGWTAVDCGPEGRCVVKGPGTLRGAAVGISGGKLVVNDVTVTQCGEVGISGAVARVSRSTVTDNGAAATAQPGGGIWVGRPHVTRSTVTGNAAFGIFASGSTLRLSLSTVTGNGLASPGCGTFATCADLVAYSAPSVRRSTCDTSAHVNGASTFGVCAND